VTYNHENPTAFTHEECEAAVGKQAILSLTGEIIAAGESLNGPFVRFKPDECWGLGNFVLGVDLDAFTIVEGDTI